MRIKDVLRHKGSAVVTVGPDATVHDLLAALSEHAVGALVVSTDGQQVDGIVSERDVVRRLHDDGADLLNQTVASIMTSDVHTCGPEDLIDDLMRAMTERRIRHIPVVVDGRLAGIVSIGDIVKFRMDELETERRQLQDYISS
ncbi:MAG: CBS domain-containing protein [Actinomycetota bacterium]|nr:CBS domain-containing protein [Actinomycetota bacterium]